MKKLLIILLAFTIIFLAGCNNSSKNMGEAEENSSQKQQNVESNDSNAKNEEQETESEIPVISENQTTENTQTKIPVLPTPVTPDSDSEPESKPESEPESKPESEPEPESPKTISTPFGELNAEVDCITVPSYGNIVDWLVEDSVFYATFEKNNRFIALNTGTGEIIYTKSFSSKPAEINAYNNEIWISFPKLKRIEVYNKSNYSLKKTLSFEYEISSFDVYGDFIFYAEDDQHVNAFKHNLKTGESICINSTMPGFSYFYEADVLVDHKNKLVIISDSFVSNTSAFCFDIETLELKSTFNGYNFNDHNSRRQSFIYDGILYWAGMQFNPTDISTPLGQYEGNGTTWVDEYFVCTNTGVYLREGYAKLLPAVHGAAYTACAASEIGDLVVVNDNTIFVFPA